jgi:23S rRNA G2445 N2-methylase RlmL
LESLTPLYEALAFALKQNVKVRLIGRWIYCFESFKAKEQLREYGFFYSGKWSAWIFSGKKKIAFNSRKSKEDIIAKYGIHKFSYSSYKQIT